MGIIVKDTGGTFTSAPEGLHQAVCVDVVDKGMQETQWGPKQQIKLVWQVEAVDEATSERFQVHQTYTASLNEKAKLRQHLEAWRGRKFSKEELAGFDVEKLIDANCQLHIVHNLADAGRVYANVQAIVPLGKGMTKMRAQDYTRIKERLANNTGMPEQVLHDDGDVPF